MAAKKGTFAVSLDLSSPEKVDEFMEALVRDFLVALLRKLRGILVRSNGSNIGRS